MTVAVKYWESSNSAEDSSSPFVGETYVKTSATFEEFVAKARKNGIIYDDFAIMPTAILSIRRISE